VQTSNLAVLLMQPRNWLPAIGLGLLWLVNLLPYAIKIRIGLAFGALLYLVLRNRRGIAATATSVPA